MKKQLSLLFKGTYLWTGPWVYHDDGIQERPCSIIVWGWHPVVIVRGLWDRFFGEPFEQENVLGYFDE